jgi:hypothetical protein
MCQSLQFKEEVSVKIECPSQFKIKVNNGYITGMDHLVKERTMRKWTQISFLFVTKSMWMGKVLNAGPHGDSIT